MEDRLINIAADSSLPPSSLALLLALGCLYDDRTGTPPLAARGVLKPNWNYTPGMAHNTISDLRAIQFLLMGLSAFGDDVGLCTSDRSLAAFWCALGPIPGLWKDNRFGFTAQLTAQLIPAASYDDRLRIAERIARIIRG